MIKTCRTCEMSMAECADDICFTKCEKHSEWVICDSYKKLTERLAALENDLPLLKATERIAELEAENETKEEEYFKMERHYLDDILKLQKELATLREQSEQVCTWKLVDADNGFWETVCFNAFCCETGTPHENNMKFCPFCGKKLEEVQE